MGMSEIIDRILDSNLNIWSEYEKIIGDRRSNHIHNAYFINLNKKHILMFHDACLYFHAEY